MPLQGPCRPNAYATRPPWYGAPTPGRRREALQLVLSTAASAEPQRYQDPSIQPAGIPGLPERFLLAMGHPLPL